MTDVKSLLGVNVGDLKTYERAAQIQEWISLQPQSDLDTLQLGLTGGRNSTETSTASTTTSTATSTTKAASVGATTGNPHTLTNRPTSGTRELRVCKTSAINTLMLQFSVINERQSNTNAVMFSQRSDAGV